MFASTTSATTTMFASGGSVSAKFRATAAPARAPTRVVIENLHGMSGRKCMLTGKKANNGRSISFSHIRTKTLQQVNLQYKNIYWPEQKRYVRLRISTNALKTLNKVGLEEMAKRAGLDLMSLPYTDADPERAQWKAENGAEPVKKNKRAPKGPKPLYIPKWKEAQLAKMAAAAAAAEKERFAKANNMVVA